MEKHRVKRKIKYKKVFVFLLICITITISIILGLNTKITNIYIKGNTILSDQEVIDIAGLTDYPSTLKNSTMILEKRLEKNISIIKASVKKKNFTKVYIDIVENRPLFYNQATKKQVMVDKQEINRKEITPLLINYVPDTIYSKFIESMASLDTDIISRISEIQYSPNEVDKGLFYLTMDDGNYVYLTLDKFSVINNYLEMVKNFKNKKGILYLDSGDYFKIME